MTSHIEHPSAGRRWIAAIPVVMLCLLAAPSLADPTFEIMRHYNMTGGQVNLVNTFGGLGLASTGGNDQTNKDDCVVGGCTCYFGSNSNYNASSVNLPLSNSDWSVGFWMNSSDTTGEKNYLGWGNTDTSRAIIIGFENGYLLLNHYSDDWVSTTNRVGAGKWNHILITRNASHEVWYINGKLNETNPQGALNIGMDYGLDIGSIFIDGGTEADGCIDEVGIWNRSLSYADAFQVYANEVQGYGYPWDAVDICIPSWSPFLVNRTCASNDTRDEVKLYDDDNNCTLNPPLVPVPGDNNSVVSSYGCDYCVPIISRVFLNTTRCIAGEKQESYQWVDANYASCCNITNIADDCAVENSTYQPNPFTINASCGETELQTGVCPGTTASVLVLVLVFFVVAFISVFGFWSNVPILTFFSAFGWWALSWTIVGCSGIIGLLCAVFGILVFLAAVFRFRSGAFGS